MYLCVGIVVVISVSLSCKCYMCVELYLMSDHGTLTPHHHFGHPFGGQNCTWPLGMLACCWRRPPMASEVVPCLAHCLLHDLFSHVSVAMPQGRPQQMNQSGLTETQCFVCLCCVPVGMYPCC